MERLRIGLVGYGFGGRFFHAPLIAAAESCVLAGVVTTSADRRALVEQEHPGVPCFDSLADLAASGAEAVAISTPADTHTPLTNEAIGLGLSVVCDKPFALDPVAAQRSCDLAVAAGVILSPYQNRRWDSDFRTVRALVDDGTLGEVLRFESRFERFRAAGPGASGGGTILDFGAHLVDQALLLLGPADRVYAEATTRADSGLDDDVFIAITHRAGGVSHLWGSWVQHAPGPRMRVTGTRASLVLTTGDTQEDVLVSGARPDTTAGTWGVEVASDLDLLHTESGAAPVVRQPGAWDTYYPAVARAVRGEGPAPVDPADAVATARVLEAARVSAGTGEVVRLT